MACFRCKKTENFIFSLKYRQRKVGLNTSEKSLVFVTIRHRKFHPYVQLSYTKISNLRKHTHFAEICCFLTFSFEGKFRKYISVKREHTKTNKNIIFSILFTNFGKKKFLFFMLCKKKKKLSIFVQKNYLSSQDEIWKFKDCVSVY